MRILITGICGFVGGAVASALMDRAPGVEILGLDNLIRPGSEQNRQGWKKRGVRLFHGDLRNASDLETLPPVDWVIDAAANPSVLAGVGDQTSSRQLIEHNLVGTINLLEFCKRVRGGLLMLSTSRVYSLRRLAALRMDVRDDAFVPARADVGEPGLTRRGITEDFATDAPISLYGASKLASEVLALEYATAFDLPVYVDRCGVLAGAGQFGKPDQGIFSFWIHAYRRRRPLRYIGFGGTGHQVRDCLHPRDLVPLLLAQVSAGGKHSGIVNVGGGADHAMSLAQLSRWCAERFGPHAIAREPEERRYDVPWLVLDSDRAGHVWDWRPTTPLAAILDEIARHADEHPDWLDWSADR